MRTFKINRNDIQGRLDAYFYHPEFVSLEKSLNSSIHDIEFFGKYIENIINGVDNRDYVSDGIRYLKVGNIKSYGLDLSGVNYIKRETLTKKISLKKNDLLLTRKGTFGIAYALERDEDFIISSEIFKITLKNINSKYIQYILNSCIGQNQFKKVSIGAIMGSLSQDSIKTIRIPVPNINIQQEIVDIMDTAYQIKKEKDEQAEELLNSTKNYLFDELGITIPKIKQNKYFAISSNKIKGRRIDFNSCAPLKTLISDSVKKSGIAFLTLNDIIDSNVVSGEWGTEEQTKNSSLVKVLRNTNFDNKFNLSFEKIAERFIENKKIQSKFLKENDILIEKSGGSPAQPVGRCAFADKKAEGMMYSNFLSKISIKKEKAISEYVYCFLKTIYSLGYMKYIQSQTTGIHNLIMDDFLDIVIPLPDKDIQNKIANEIKHRIDTAKKLKEEAISQLDSAKQKVEDILLN